MSPYCPLCPLIVPKMSQTTPFPPHPTDPQRQGRQSRRGQPLSKKKHHSGPKSPRSRPKSCLYRDRAMGWLRHLHRASGPCFFWGPFPTFGGFPRGLSVRRGERQRGGSRFFPVGGGGTGREAKKSPGQSPATAQRRGKGSVTGRDGLIHPFAAGYFRPRRVSPGLDSP